MNSKSEPNIGHEVEYIHSHSNPSRAPSPTQLTSQNFLPKEFIPKRFLSNPVTGQRSSMPSFRSLSSADQVSLCSLPDVLPEGFKTPPKISVRITTPKDFNPPTQEPTNSSTQSPAPHHLATAESSPSNTARSTKSQGIQKHPSYYFPDGGVVLQLKHVQFKVHPHLIGRQSQSLARLFAVERPAHTQVVDGCKLYLLPGEPRDFESLLSVLYDGFTHITKSLPFSFDFTARILRASTIHSFPSLRLWALQELQSVYSPDLERFDPENTTLCEERVILARECEVNWLAKTGLYHAAALKELGISERDGPWDSDDETEDDASGAQEQKRPPQLLDVSLDTSLSSIVSLSSLSSACTYPLRTSTRTATTLPLADLQLVIRLLEKFQQRWIHIARPPTTHCSNHPVKSPSDTSWTPETQGTSTSLTCTQIFSAVWSTHVLPSKKSTDGKRSLEVERESRATIFAAGFYNPLKGFQTLCDIEWEKLGVCDACGKAVRAEWVQEKRGIWSSMDRWLELGTD